MSQEHIAKSNGEGKFGFGWAIVIIVLGILFVALSMRVGKKWDTGEIAYDIGMAILTVALVELLIIRAFKLWANRKTSLERQTEIVSQGLSSLIAITKKITEAPLTWSEFNAQIGIIDGKMDLLTIEVNNIKRDVEAIRGKNNLP